MALAPLFAFTPNDGGGTFKLLEETTIVWTGKKVTGQHTGTVLLKSGKITTDGKTVTGGKIVIDMSSILVSDLKAGEGKEDLEGHLKSADFFNTAEFDTAVLVIRHAERVESEEANHQIKAELTIKGITQVVTFPANLEVTKSGVKGTASITFDRTKFDVKYNSGSFFSDLGDYMIYDDVTLDISLKAAE